jgi:two-component system chemotaxis sensor kinase CheA
MAIDAVLDTEELVVKPAAPAVMASGLYAGQTLPDSGLPLLLLDSGGIAAVAGLRFAPTMNDAADAVHAVEEAGITALLFDDLDGVRRAIALGVVDRVETAPFALIRTTGGRRHLTVDGGVIPLIAVAEPTGGEGVAVLRLTDGFAEIGYAIAEPHEIVTLPAAIAPARDRPGIVGVAVIDGEQIELINPHALFAGEATVSTERPLCLLRCDGSGWMDTFLRPVLEASGYRCASWSDGNPNQPGAITLTMDDCPADVPLDAVLTLRRQVAATPGSTSIYRYDRTALIAALEARLTRAGGSKRNAA